MPPTGGLDDIGDDIVDDVGAIVEKAAAVLRNGGLVAYPTDTVYGLGADIFNPAAIQRLFAVKGRSAERALPILLADSADVAMVASNVPRQAAVLAGAFWPGPLTLVVRRHSRVPDIVVGGGETIGIRVPDHAIPRSLCRKLGRPITGTSANSSGHPPHRNADGVNRDIGARVDLIIPGDCGADSRPSTVVDCTKSPPEVIRAGALSLEDIRCVCAEAVAGKGLVRRQAAR